MANLTTDSPKSLLIVEGKSIIERSLDILDARGLHQVTFVVGYMRELFMQGIGERYKNITIDYVASPDYATTEHGWSLFLARESWLKTSRDIVFMDADNLYHPALLDAVLTNPAASVVLVDDQMVTVREEEIVTGSDQLVHHLKRGYSETEAGYVGGFVGINKFSATFVAQLFAFMETFFVEHGRNYKYERLFDAFIHATGTPLHYMSTNGLPWLNINHEQDLSNARQLVFDLQQHAGNTQ